VRDREKDTLLEHLDRIEGYMRGCELLSFPRERSPERDELAAFLRRRLPEVLERWLPIACKAFGIPPDRWEEVRESMAAAQERWIAHVEDPSDVETYRYLREHARGGFISQHPASRFLAGQLKIYHLFRSALVEEYGSDGPKSRELLSLLDQEIQERLLHITDFFVEARLEELNAQEASYQQTIEHAPAAIFRLSFDDGRILEANRVAELVTGYSREELAGRPVWELHPPEERERVRQCWLDTRIHGHRAADDLHLVHRSGRPVPVFVNTGLIEYGKQRFIQRICVDLSERRRLESQLVQSEKMAAIGQLAAGVAHEIRNPLGAIRNALYDLKEILVDGPEEAQEDLRIAEEELERARAIIDSLLEFSRVSRVETEPVHLNQVLEKTLLLTGKALRNSDIVVETEFGDIPPCRANENELRQVVLNLITNAVQAMPDGGTLRLRTGFLPASNGQGPRVVLEVSDSGVGIPPEHLKDIFNPFFTTKEPGQGTGLGLSVVDSIVRRNRGRIHVESEPGKGATFRLEFPCDAPIPEQDTSEGEPLDASRTP
jgi:PAS domain S-box-containing protein